MRELFYIGGGIAVGWFVSKLFRGGRLKRNAGWILREMSVAGTSGSYEVFVEGRLIGYGWSGVSFGDEPLYDAVKLDDMTIISSGHESPDDAAEALYEWDLEQLAVLSPGTPTFVPRTTKVKTGVELDPVERIFSRKPSFAKGYEVWTTEVTGRFVILLDGHRVGYIEGYGASYKAYAQVRDKTITVGLSVTKQNAIGAVAAVDTILRFLLSQREYSEVSVRSTTYYEVVETFQVWRPLLVAAKDVADSTGLPLKLVEEIGKLLAQKKLIFGVSGRIKIPGVVRRQELIVPTKEEFERGRSRRRRGRKTSLEHRRRRIVSAQSEAEKLRKSPALSKEEKKTLPRARSILRYSFALYGPDGAVGMFEAGSRKVKEYLEQDWTETDRERFQKRLEQRELDEAEAKEADLKKARERTEKKRVESPFEMTQEEALKRLFSGEGEHSGEFFEEQRLAGLDFVSRRRQDRDRVVRKVDHLRQRVEKLQGKFLAARKHFHEAKEKGHAGRALQAVAAITKKEVQLAEARMKLEEAEAELARFRKRMG